MVGLLGVYQKLANWSSSGGASFASWRAGAEGQLAGGNWRGSEVGERRGSCSPFRFGFLLPVNGLTAV